MVLAGQAYLLGLAFGAALALPGWSAHAALHGLGVLLAKGGDDCAAGHPVRAGRQRRPRVPGGGRRGVRDRVRLPDHRRLGYGQYFPWSVPAIYSGIAGPDQPPPEPLAYLLVVAVGLAGAAATAAWWRSADQTT
jgi:ABC-2 type transport system permease protein